MLGKFKGYSKCTVLILWGFFLRYGSRKISHFNMGPVNIYLERVDKLNCRVKTVLTEIKN